MSEIKCKVLAVENGGDKSKKAAKRFALFNLLNKSNRKLKKKKKSRDLDLFCYHPVITLLHFLHRKRKHCLQKLLMPILAHKK